MSRKKRNPFDQRPGAHPATAESRNTMKKKKTRKGRLLLPILCAFLMIGGMQGVISYAAEEEVESCADCGEALSTSLVSNGDNTHSFVTTCSGCDFSSEETKICTYAGYQHDETSHWQECSVCGAKKAVTPEASLYAYIYPYTEDFDPDAENIVEVDREFDEHYAVIWDTVTVQYMQPFLDSAFGSFVSDDLSEFYIYDIVRITTSLSDVTFVFQMAGLSQGDVVYVFQPAYNEAGELVCLQYVRCVATTGGYISFSFSWDMTADCYAPVYFLANADLSAIDTAESHTMKATSQTTLTHTLTCSVCGYEKSHALTTITDLAEDGSHTTYTYCETCEKVMETISSDTDAMYFFAWEKQEDGTFVRQVSCECGYSFWETFQPEASEGFDLTVTLHVLSDGAPVEGATFAMYCWSADTPVATKTTDETGTVVFDAVPNETCYIIQTDTGGSGALLTEPITVLVPLELDSYTVKKKGLDTTNAYYSEVADTYTYFAATYTVSTGQSLTMPRTGGLPFCAIALLGGCLVGGAIILPIFWRRRKKS